MPQQRTCLLLLPQGQPQAQQLPLPPLPLTVDICMCMANATVNVAASAAAAAPTIAAAAAATCVSAGFIAREKGELTSSALLCPPLQCACGCPSPKEKAADVLAMSDQVRLCP